MVWGGSESAVVTTSCDRARLGLEGPIGVVLLLAESFPRVGMAVECNEAAKRRDLRTGVEGGPSSYWDMDLPLL